jgi:hypothetical protein
LNPASLISVRRNLFGAADRYNKGANFKREF